ncbi:MAG: Dabb family protein [Pseudobutyrivibrio sp.]|nr:Dabb family protein [Pseudobutyrivibrio sp.]
MVKQIIIWKLQDKCFGPNLESIKSNIKHKFEELSGRIDGLSDIEVHSNCMSSSNGDVALIATFDSEEAQKQCRNDEDWNAVMKDAVVPFIQDTNHVEFSL